MEKQKVVFEFNVNYNYVLHFGSCMSKTLVKAWFMRATIHPQNARVLLKRIDSVHTPPHVKYFRWFFQPWFKEGWHLAKTFRALHVKRVQPIIWKNAWAKLNGISHTIRWKKLILFCYLSNNNMLWKIILIWINLSISYICLERLSAD